MNAAARNHIDLTTMIMVLILMAASLGIVYSASATWAAQRYGESSHVLGLHAVKVLIGFLVMFAAMKVDYHLLLKHSKTILVALVVVLAVTLMLGVAVKGAARWLRVGAFGLQPSEFAKYALVMHLSALIAMRGELIRDFKTGYLPMLIWSAAVTVLVLLQPNFSTGAMIFGISLVMLFAGRAKMSHLALTVASLLPLLLAYMVSAPYRMYRVLSYAGPIAKMFHVPVDTSAVKSNYQLAQGIIGFGNGGLFGVGPGLSRQRDLFLPESYGDFVYSIVGEEYGLIGTVFLLAVFLVIMLRGIRIARHAPDEFGRMLALGITAAITLYALINAGVTLGILPTTGLPMPFISYGGSSMLASSFAIGVLLNISSQTDLNPRLAAPKARDGREADKKPAQAVGMAH